MKNMLKKVFVLLMIVALLPLGFVGMVKGITINSFTAYPNTVNTAANYSISFSLSNNLTAPGTITLGLSGFQLPTSGTTDITSSVTTSNFSFSKAVVSSSGVVITTSSDVYATNPVSINILSTLYIKNPPIGGRYPVTISTSVETTAVSTYVNIRGVTVNVDNLNAGSVAGFSIQYFSGKDLSSTSNDYIDIEFPYGSSLPSSFSSNQISISQSSFGSLYYLASSDITLISPTKIRLKVPTSFYGVPTLFYGGYPISINIPQSVGIKNPPTAGTYTIKVYTSQEYDGVTSNQYQIMGSTISSLYVTADPLTQNSNAEYTFTFKTSSSGALTANSDKIYIQFPTEFNVPTSIPGSYVTVNGTPCNTTVTVSSDKLTITTPIYISYSTNVTIVISKSANIYNPPSPGTYTFKVSTSKDVVEATDTLTIVKSMVSKPLVQFSSYGVGEAVQVQVQFTTGSGGALTTTDTISVVFPTGFTLPASISQSLVKVNNYAAVSVTKSGNRFDIRPSISIPANSNVIIVIDQSANIRNPSTQGDYKISVYTSKETTPVESDTFKIVNLPKTTISVTPAQPDGENGYYKTTPIVVLSATSPVDTAPQIYYYIDSGAQQLYSAPISIPDGTHTLYFFAKDRYGN
ncbi:MAG: hypothetical protein KBH03_07640, partial [Paludibacteraceae bacterium]|nr:hypothetical protein [Paludibacteraceae bacterium]